MKNQQDNLLWVAEFYRPKQKIGTDVWQVVRDKLEDFRRNNSSTDQTAEPEQVPLTAEQLWPY